MSDPDELQKILSDPFYCQQMLSQVFQRPPPSRKNRNYDAERSNMIQEKVWYTLANRNFNPIITLYRRDTMSQ